MSEQSSSAADAIYYPLGDTTPIIGQSMEVAPGVRWIKMRLPFALDHINF